MAEVKTINVYTKHTSTFRIVIRHTIVWSYLVGAEGLSHWWFGGSWVIDIMVLTGAITLAIGSIMKETGKQANMTTGEIRLWVAAGMPLDVKQWRIDRRLQEVA